MGRRCLLRETGRASGEHAVGGWRQWRYLTREVRSLFHRVRSTRRAKRHPERVEAYLARSLDALRRASMLLLVRRLCRSCSAADRRWSGGWCGARRYLTKRRSSPRWVQGQGGYAELGLIRINSSCTTRSCGRVRMWTWRAAGAESAGAVSGVAGVQLRPGLSQPGQPGRAGRAARPERVAEEGTRTSTESGRKRHPSRPRAVCTRRLSRRTGGSTVSAIMVSTASRVRLPCRCWPPTCIASG